MKRILSLILTCFTSLVLAQGLPYNPISSTDTIIVNQHGYNVPIPVSVISTAGTVTSVFGQTGIVPNLSGDCTTSGSSVTNCLSTNGTPFGSMAIQNANAVNITGGAITGLSSPLPVASGGTGSTTSTGTGSNVLNNSPTLISPALGTPSSGVATNLTGTASGLTAGTVTTNANLTGPITSTGNATSVASQTGTGSKFVMDTSPTLISPALGTPSSGVATNLTGTAAGLTAGTVTTNANLTGPITSVGNATSIAAQTGTGSTFVMNNGPTLIAPALGTPASGIATNLTGTASGLTAGNVTTNANLTGPITSSGNATSVAAQTGTGSTFVMQASPTLTTPNIGAATGTSIAVTGAASSSTVTTTSTTALESAPLGSNILSSSGWTSTGWTGSFGGGFTHTTGNTSTLSNSTAVTSGAYYLLTFTINGATGGLVTPSVGGITSVPNGGDIVLSTTPANGTYFYGPFTVATTGVSFSVTSTFNGTLSNISLQQVTGTYSPTYVLTSSAATNDFEIRSAPNSLGVSTFLGVGAGAQNSTYAYQNTAVGAQAMASNVSGVQNTCVGYYCLNLNATGNFDVCVGHLCMAQNTSGYDNAFVGDAAATANTTGKANSGLGNGVMQANTTGSNNTSVGNHSMGVNTTGSYNEAFGNFALGASIDGTRNVAIGTNALSTSVHGTDNTAVGDNAMALWNSAIAGYNVGIGSNALAAATTLSNDVAIGGQAGQALTSGSNNTLIGAAAGITMTSAKNTVIIGHNAAPAATTGWYNTIIGGDSANLLSTGQFNTFLGYGATSTSATVNQSVAIGYTATVTASNQIMLGTSTENVVLPGTLTIKNLVSSVTAPTISSGFGTSPTIDSNNGSLTFRVNVGTGGTASSGVVGLPTAATGWNCMVSAFNPSTAQILNVTEVTASTTTSVTVQNDLISTGAATAWPASQILTFICAAY